MRSLRVFVAAIAALPALAPPARAATPIAEVICEPSAQLARKLSRQFGARLSAWGTRGPEQVMQVWTDARGGWTLVVRYATGTSCIVAMGSDWSGAPPADPA